MRSQADQRIGSGANAFNESKELVATERENSKTAAETLISSYNEI